MPLKYGIHNKGNGYTWTVKALFKQYIHYLHLSAFVVWEDMGSEHRMQFNNQCCPIGAKICFPMERHRKETMTSPAFYKFHISITYQSPYYPTNFQTQILL